MSDFIFSFWGLYRKMCKIKQCNFLTLCSAKFKWAWVPAMVFHSPSSSLWASGEESDWEDENSSFHFFLFFGGGSAFTFGCLALGFTEETFVAVGFGVGGSGGLMLLLLGLQWTVLQYYEENVHDNNYHPSFGSNKIAINLFNQNTLPTDYIHLFHCNWVIYTLYTTTFLPSLSPLETGKQTGMLISEIQSSVL